jgi:hypothetical protein
MAKTKDQLRTENNASFPNNNSQFITPEKLRNYNTDVIDSVALEVNPQLSGEGTFGSLSGSSFVSASTFVGDGSKLENVAVTLPSGTVSGSSQIILDDTTGDLSGSRITGSVDTSISASFATTASFALNVTPIDTGSFARTDIANNFTGSNNTFPMQFDLRLTNSAPNEDSRFRFDSFQNRIQMSLKSDDTFFNREIRFYPSASYTPGYPQDSELGFNITEGGAFSYGNKLGLTNLTGDNLGTFEISSSAAGDSYVTYLGNNKVMELVQATSDFIIHNNINARGGIDAQGRSTFFNGLEVQNGFTASLQEGNLFVGNGSNLTSQISTGSFVKESETGSFARTDIANNFTGSNNTFPLQFDLRPTNSPASGDPRFRFDSFQNLMQISYIGEDTFFDREIRFYPSASYAPGYPQNSELRFTIKENQVLAYTNKLGLTSNGTNNLGTFEISGSASGDSYVTYLGDNKVMEFVQASSDFIMHNNINARGGFTSTADSIVKSGTTTAFTVSSGDSDTSPIVMEGGADFVTKFDSSKISGVGVLETGLIQNSVNDFQMGSDISNGRGIYNAKTGSTSEARIILEHGADPSVENVRYQSFLSQGATSTAESKLILKGTEIDIQASTGSKQTSVNINGDVTASNLNISDVINLTNVDPLPTGNVGDLAVSSSQLYFYNGAWTQIS